MILLAFSQVGESQQRLAESQDQNERNQRAILRLLDEMTNLAGILLSGSDTKINKDSRILVINKSGLVAALLVEEVFGLRRFKHDERQDKIDPNTGSIKKYLAGVFADQARRWNVFSVEKLVETEQFLRVV